MAIQAAYHKAEQANPRDDAPKAGVVRNLGLLDKEEDTKKVLGMKWELQAGLGGCCTLGAIMINASNCKRIFGIIYLDDKRVGMATGIDF